MFSRIKSNLPNWRGNSVYIKHFRIFFLLLVVITISLSWYWYGGYNFSSIFRGVKKVDLVQSLRNNMNYGLKHAGKARRYERNTILEQELYKIISRLEQGNHWKNKHWNTTYILSEVTLVLNCVTEMESRILIDILKNLTSSSNTNYHNTYVTVGLTKNDYNINRDALTMYKKKLKNLQLVEISSAKHNKISLARSLATLMKNVNTKFIFVAREIVEFRSDSLIKMIVPLLNQDSDIISGVHMSSRDGFDIGCLQFKSLWSQLKIVRGYDAIIEKSHAICDYSSAPFTLPTILFQIYLKDSSTNVLNSDLLYLDFFYKMKEDQKLLKVCLDCLWKTNSNTEILDKVPREDWLHLFKRLELNELYLPSRTNVAFRFACNEIYSDTKTSCTRSPKKTLLLPKCCINELDDMFAYSIRLFHENNMSYTLDSGTGLGSAKLRMTIPWEIDHDLSFEVHHLMKLATFSTRFKKAGYVMDKDIDKECVKDPNDNRFSCGYIGIETKRWTVELYGENTLACHAYTKSEEKRLPTYRIKGNCTLTSFEKQNIWTVALNNPGLYGRSRLGIGCLKHHRHWTYVAKKQTAFNYVIKADRFPECERPGHHLCFNNYLNDGNLLFLQGPWA